MIKFACMDEKIKVEKKNIMVNKYEKLKAKMYVKG